MNRVWKIWICSKLWESFKFRTRGPIKIWRPLFLCLIYDKTRRPLTTCFKKFNNFFKKYILASLLFDDFSFFQNTNSYRKTEFEAILVAARVCVHSLLTGLPGSTRLRNSQLMGLAEENWFNIWCVIEIARQTFPMRPVQRKVGSERNSGIPPTFVKFFFSQSYLTAFCIHILSFKAIFEWE